MSKITNVRLPNAASDGYSAAQTNQLIRSLEQIVFQLNNTYTAVISDDTASASSWFAAGSGAGGGFAGGIRGFQTSNGIALPYAMLISNADQSSAGITSENLITYTSVSPSNGISVVDSSKIYVPCAGQYLVEVSLQVANHGSAAAEFEVWAKDTGTNIALSNRRFDVAARKSLTIWSHIVPAVSFIFTVNAPSTNYLQLAWWSDGADTYLEHYAAGTTPTRPAIPSVILTINFVSAV